MRQEIVRAKCFPREESSIWRTGKLGFEQKGLCNLSDGIASEQGPDLLKHSVVCYLG